MADELKKRFGAFAEGIVVMVCPVIVAIALGKIDLRVYGNQVFFAMLAMAGITLIIGICPFLVCWIPGTFPGVNPVPVTAILATVSSCSLLILACLIAQFVVSKQVLIPVGVLSGFLLLLQAVLYYHQEKFEPYPTETAMDKMLNQSHEFLTGITGVLFLGLEGLALEGHDDPMFEKGGAVAIASFIVCAAGVCMIYLEMTTRTDCTEGQIVHLTLTLDSSMAGGTLGLLTAVVYNSLEHVALTLLGPPFVILIVLVCRVAIDRRSSPVNDVEDPSAVQDVQLSAPTVQVPARDVQLSAPASLELTRVTFAGFLAVSITVIRNTPPSKLTGWFLLFAALAIVFGLSWRLLSQAHIRRSFTGVAPDCFDSSANLASIGIHVCIVIATVLLLVMAWTARGKPCQVVKPCT